MRSKAKMSSHYSLSTFLLEVLANATRQEKEIEGIQIKEEGKNCLLFPNDRLYRKFERTDQKIQTKQKSTLLTLTSNYIARLKDTRLMPKLIPFLIY